MAPNYGVSVKWLSVACFELQMGGMHIVTDPCVTDSSGTDLTWEAIEGCDLITLSHGHWDHISDLPVLTETYRPLLFTGDHTAMAAAKWLNCSPTRLYPMAPDQELDFGSIRIQALYGRHRPINAGFNDHSRKLETYKPWPLAHPETAELQAWGSLEYRNFLFTLPGGVKVLHWGNVPDEQQRRVLAPLQPQICILQFARPEIRELAAFAADIGCKVLIPHHMDLSFTEAEYTPWLQQLRTEFLKLVPDGQMIIPTHGQWLHL